MKLIRYSAPFVRCTRYALQLLFFVLMSGYVAAQNTPTITVTQRHANISTAPFMEEYVDAGDSVSTIQTIAAHNPFKKTKGQTPIYGQQVKSVWLRFKVQNNTSFPTLFLNIPYPNLSLVSLYQNNNSEYFIIGKEGNAIEIVEHAAPSPNIILNLKIAPGHAQEYVLHIQSEHPIMLPAFVTTEDALHNNTSLQTVVIGLYLGVLLIMFLYNLFLYFATRDGNYFVYTVYLFLLALAQVTVSGYGFRYLWPNASFLNQYAVVWTSSLSALSGLVFSMYFLQTKRYSKAIHKVIKVLIGVYLLGMITCFFGRQDISYNILNYNSLLSVIVVLIASVYIAKKGFRSAYFYLIAWLALLLSFIVLVLRNINVVPYNTFTAYIFLIGSTLEVALLSIALADKINILRKEKETSQALALEASLENERLVREQNVELESKVAERTEELQDSNHQLTEAFKELKDAQIQLVEAEKMASLGQLTAGIAHEINNPINFVKSNIKPLQLDFKDIVEVIDEYEKLHKITPDKIQEQLSLIDNLKKEIDLEFVKGEVDNLLKGIKEGAERTADIVRGLRTFSRLDESQIKTVNIHEGIESTLVLLRNSSPDYVNITMDFKADGNIECFPGKLNQVFMNIISNAIQAIKDKHQVNKPESIHISTRDIPNDEIEISIKDSGPGMSPEIKQKIFDPFFTTKDVGEGTGLGLAIVFKIIQEHSGKIDVISSEGEGAEFIITLHHIVPEKPTI
jgi:two-component system NtrC family sensor kinase